MVCTARLPGIGYSPLFTETTFTVAACVAASPTSFSFRFWAESPPTSSPGQPAVKALRFPRLRNKSHSLRRQIPRLKLRSTLQAPPNSPERPPMQALLQVPRSLALTDLPTARTPSPKCRTSFCTMPNATKISTCAFFIPTSQVHIPSSSFRTGPAVHNLVAMLLPGIGPRTATSHSSPRTMTRRCNDEIAAKRTLIF